MGDVGAELPAEGLPVLPLGDVQNGQHRSRQPAIPHHGVGQKLIVPALPLQKGLAVPPRQGLLHHMEEGLRPAQMEHALP